MTNYEKNSEFIKTALTETGACQFGVKRNDDIVYCAAIECAQCKFISDDCSCNMSRANWLKEEAKPPITEQLIETIREAVIECSDISCDNCVYYTLNEISRKRESCISGRIADVLRSKFDITNKEDKIDE